MIFTFPVAIRFREIRRASGGVQSGNFEGLASTWNRDRHGTRIARGAFRRSVEALAAGKLKIPLLHEHDQRAHLGTVNGAEETAEGLHVEGVIVLGTELADRQYDLARAGALGLSVGFTPLEPGIEIDAGDVVFTDLDWVELSTTSVASNRESMVLSIRSAAPTPGELEQAFREHFGAPRRLAAQMTRACLPLLGAELEPEHDPVEVAALAAALDGAIKNFKR